MGTPISQRSAAFPMTSLLRLTWGSKRAAFAEVSQEDGARREHGYSDASVRAPLTTSRYHGLVSHSPVPRRATRRPVRMAATCRTQSGLRDNAYISDLSPEGCRLTTSTLSVRIGLRIVIRPQGLEGVCGTVRWIDGQDAGIQFDAPLYEPVVDHLSQRYADTGRAVDVASC